MLGFSELFEEPQKFEKSECCTDSSKGDMEHVQLQIGSLDFRKTERERCYINRKKSFWKVLSIILLGLLIISLGCTVIFFMASYENYPSGYSLKYLHQIGHLADSSEEHWVHIDTYSAMNGISRFCENDVSWRYSKEEGIPLEEFHKRNFTYLLNEHSSVDGYKCLFTVDGFSRVRPQMSFPPWLLVGKEQCLTQVVA
ncbi:dol-P-Man:Man(7)GlcNAc(2)-PP-Dol alpha-1,6-mannosyltransferase-like [Pistacia vera]|uniref:dol-P-Man:Man(7)GlcNAc(2)-PP-Dol alpha-1,6-mannosyltransferase-like n=1 Tax=Pistacia vera TaxID=55513 RepID=UPI0012638E2A|nr:dol-P-Man:Man(7)GlcNAc(2)-PP-Dol alpha-1,6-mannosyltransferase-like [Pistacia vera]